MRTRLMLLSALLTLLVTACGDRGTKELQPAGAASPGTRLVTCDVSSASGQSSFAFVLPDGYVEGLPESYHLDAPGCGYHLPTTVRDDSDPEDGHQSEVIVVVYRASKGLEEIRDEAAKDAVDGETPKGDDSNLDLHFDDHVTTYGSTVGDRFTYLCFCDGQNNRHWYAQADGIRMSWEAEDELKNQIDRQFEAALTSAGTLS